MHLMDDFLAKSVSVLLITISSLAFSLAALKAQDKQFRTDRPYQNTVATFCKLFRDLENLISV